LNNLSPGKKTAGRCVPRVELLAASIISFFNCLFVATCLGSVATQTATVLLLSMDFLINLYLCFGVWRKYKQEKWAECGEAMMELVLIEWVEFMVPLLYLLCFLAAFYSHNAHVIGKIIG
jgi:hypothetical protein